MEKWKVIVIALLLGSMVGYGFYTSRPVAPVDNPPGVTPTPDPSAQALLGKPVPGWSIPAQYWVNTPRPITPQDVKGKVTLLEFWRSGCSHCEAAAPFMRDLYTQFKPRGLQMVTIQTPGRADPGNPENDWKKVQQVVRDWNLPYPVGFDKDGILFKTKYKGHLWPTVILLDRQGKVISLHTGHDDQKAMALVQAIESQLGKKPSGAPK